MWISRFSEGRETVKDDSRIDRQVTPEEKLNAIEVLVKEDRRVAIRDVETMTIENFKKISWQKPLGQIQ